MAKQNFLIISPFDGNAHPPGAPTYAEISKITSKSIIDYADRHGYYYAICDEDLSGRAISWDKVFLARKFSEAPYDFIWCIDSDVMILNNEIKLESIVDDEHDVFITCYKNEIDHLNTGSIIYRNTSWTREFLKQIWEDEEFIAARPNCFFEQSTIIKYYKNHPEEQHRFKMIPVTTINSHYHSGMESLGINYRPGHLAVHLAGSDNEYRYETFLRFEEYRKNLSIEFNIPMWNK